ncbi:MAG: hypothetical protein MUC82_12590 [Cypionkella sp.]|jgi:hypothetical protein|nr:hypothetical protein [Cypionkella sp.]
MTTTPTVPPRPSLGLRILYAIPLIGRIARDIARDVNNAFYLLIVILTLEIIAFQIWGPVVFTLTALCLVPLMFLFFVAISWPKGSSRKG